VKYCIVIIDGAAGLPLPEHGDKTCLELANTPNLDAMARAGVLGLARTVPPGMEPSSACACMSVLGYNPVVYYRGRAAIEARSMGITVNSDEVVFRCNLVTIHDNKMHDYSCGHIATGEARELIEAINDELGSDRIHFYPGISYRHICKIKGREDTLAAICTPPHDIPGKDVAGSLPRGAGSDILRDLMAHSEAVLRRHPVNAEREARGDVPATSIWLFWGSGRVPEIPPFQQLYGLSAALTSGVDLLKGLADMAEIEILDIAGVTDGPDNDYPGQANGALEALKEHDLCVIHVEAPDEAAHAGSTHEKIEAIQKVDREVLGRLRSYAAQPLRILVMPDHPTPIQFKTHTAEPVPFLLWGAGFNANGAGRFTEAEAIKTGVFVDPGYNIIRKLIA